MDPNPPEPNEPRPTEPVPPAAEPQPVMPGPPGGDAVPRTEPPVGDPAAGAPTPRGRRLLAIVVVAAVLLVGGGAAAAFLKLRGSDVEVLGLVPASTDVVVTAYLDPSAGQKVNLLALAHKFPALANQQDLRSQVNDALDQALANSGLDHSDLQGWVGSQVAVAVDFNADSGSTSVAVVIASSDDGLATSTLQKAVKAQGGTLKQRDYRGVTVSFDDSASFAIVDHAAVIAQDATAINRVIDTARGTIPNLVDDPAFTDTISALPQGKLGLVYVNPADFVSLLDSLPLGGQVTGQPGLDALRAMKGIGLSVSAQPDGIAIDTTIRYDPTKLDPATRQQLDEPAHRNATLSFVPADSFAVITQQNVDLALKQMVDQALSTPQGERLRSQLGLDDTISALTGDAVFEVGHGTAAVPAGGALVIGISDAAPVQHTLDQLADLALAYQSSSTFTVQPTAGLTKRQERSLGLLTRQPKPSWKTISYQGTTIRYLQGSGLDLMGLAPAYAVLDGAAVIASNPAEIRKLIDTKAAGSDVTTSAAYARALARVPKGASSFYVNVEGIISEVGGLLPPDVRQNVEPVKSLVAGSDDSSTRSNSRFFIEIR
jgi:Protein of unknown function (DUF3352)